MSDPVKLIAILFGGGLLFVLVGFVGIIASPLLGLWAGFWIYKKYEDKQFWARLRRESSPEYQQVRRDAERAALTAALVTEVAALPKERYLPSPDDFAKKFIEAYYDRCANDDIDPMSEALLLAYVEIVHLIYKCESYELYFKPEPPKNPSPIEDARFKDRLRAHIDNMAKLDDGLKCMEETFVESARLFTLELPTAARLPILPPDDDDEEKDADKEPPAPAFSVPLIATLSPDHARRAVNNIRLPFLDERAKSLGVFRDFAVQFNDNTLEATEQKLSAAAIERGERLFPNEHKGSPRELVALYLKNALFDKIFEVEVPFVISKAARFEHSHVVAGTGHGKTQLLQRMMLADFDDPERPAVVAIDSQGDMLKTLSHLARFNPEIDDRLIIVNPADYEWPLRLNIFDIPRERMARMSPGMREQTRAGIIELYDYIFGGLLGADLTQKQSVVFRYMAALIIEIPDATIQTLRQLLENPASFAPYIARTRGTTRAFFENEFMSRQFADTRQQIIRRLYGLLSNPTFERMFSHPRNALDMKAALDQGKIILINTAKDVLKAEASQMFGRYMIALIMQAALERAADPEHLRRPAFVYIDEAADYFDENIDTLLIQARKYKVGLTFAHQHLDQLSGKLYSSVMTNPAIRFVGGLSASDARALAQEMHTSPDFLQSPKKRAGATEFAVYVRNYTQTPVILSVPLGVAEREPKMSASQYEALLARVRTDIAASLTDTEEHIVASVPASTVMYAPPPSKAATAATPASAPPREPPRPAATDEFSDSY